MKNSINKKYLIHISILFIISLYGCNVDEIPPALASGLRGWFTIDENNIGVNISWYEVEDDDLDKYIIFKGKNGMSPEEIGETGENYFIDTDGNGFSDYPLATIQAGINASSSGDTVLASAGTYTENINYNGKNIVVGSLYLTTQDTSYISSTIIDGNANGSVVTFESGEDSTAVLSGFTIQNGYNYIGGGILCENNSNPNITNLIISNNEADYGGGIDCENSSPIITNTSILNNTAPYGGGINGGYTNLIMNTVIISNNYAESKGGGICLSYSSPTLSNLLVINNTSFKSTCARWWSVGYVCKFNQQVRCSSKRCNA